MEVQRKMINEKIDLIAIALYKCAFDLQRKVRIFEKQLEEHLKSKYILTDKGWDFESVISDVLYGNEGDVEEFLSMLKSKAKLKKGEKKNDKRK